MNRFYERVDAQFAVRKYILLPFFVVNTGGGKNKWTAFFTVRSCILNRRRMQSGEKIALVERSNALQQRTHDLENSGTTSAITRTPTGTRLSFLIK